MVAAYSICIPKVNKFTIYVILVTEPACESTSDYITSNSDIFDIYRSIFSFSAERELVEFLTEEILAERKAQKIKTTANQLEGFSITYDGAEVELSKKAEKEK